MTAWVLSRALFIGLAFGIVVSLSGCDVFAPRSPASPIGEGGTFVQPDAPDLVVENIRAAIAELNTANYRRSLADDLMYQPTAAAEASDPSLWAGWSKTQDVSSFTTIAEAARLSNGHNLRLEDQSVEIGNARYTLDATYVLIVRHRRADVPDTLQGRLIWEIEQGSDGLWQLHRWTDRQLGNSPSWSDLKAGFAK